MRKLLFRGQTRRKGEKLKNVAGDPMDSNWVYGGIFLSEGDMSVLYSYKPVDKWVVYTDTVGQFIGLTDIHDKMIFEGDILKTSDNILFVVEYDVENARFIGRTIERERRIIYPGREPKAEIVGNIYDNPELLQTA